MLSKECKVQHRSISELDLNSYMIIAIVMTILKYIARLPQRGENLPISISSRLVRALKSVWSPFCVSGKINSCSYSNSNAKLYEESTIYKINLAELIAVATICIVSLCYYWSNRFLYVW